MQQRNWRKLKAQCLRLDQNYCGIIAQSSDAHMCMLAIVMETCSYGIYFWRMGGNQL